MTIDRRALAVERDALRRIGTLAGDGPQEAMFATMAEEIARIVDVETGATQSEMAGIVRFEGDELVVLAAWGKGPSLPAGVGTRWPLEGESATVRVSRTGRPARHDGSYEPGTSAISDRATAVGARSTVAVPIVVDGVLWGAATVLSSRPEPLPADTEDRLAALADVAATAISNAEARARARRLADEQSALRRIATRVAEGADPTAIADAVTAELGGLHEADMAGLVRFEDGGMYRILSAWDAERPVEGLTGRLWPLEGGGTAARVAVARRSIRIDDWDDASEPHGEVVRERLGLGASVASPILVGGRMWGTVEIHSREHQAFPGDTEARLERFAELVATAVSNAEARENSRRLTDEQIALRRVATLVAERADLDAVAEAVVAASGSLLGAMAAIMVHIENEDSLRVLAAWSETGDAPDVVGTYWPLAGSLTERVAQSRKPERIADWEADRGDAARGILETWGAASSVAAPVLVHGDVWGAVILHYELPEGFPLDTAERLRNFAELIAAAISDAQARNEVRRLAEEQAALRRVATLVAQGSDPAVVSDAVIAEIGQILDADVAAIVDMEPDSLPIRAAWARDGDGSRLLGVRGPIEGSLSQRIAATGTAARVDDWELESGPMAELMCSGFALRSSVGCPVLVGGEISGVVVVYSKRAYAFPPDTEARLQNFADLVTTAIANAEAGKEIRRLADEQAALRRVATFVAEHPPPEAVFDAVAREVEQLIGVGHARLLRYEPDGTATVMATSGLVLEQHPVGANIPMDSPTAGGLVLRTGKPARVDDFEHMEGELAAQLRSMDIRSAAGAPITVGGQLWGVILASSFGSDVLPDRTVARLTDFTELVTTAISNAQARADVAASRARIVAATDEARRRFERDLHDGAQQRLVSLTLALRGVEAMTPPELAPFRAELARVGDGITEVLDDLRELSRGLHPAILAEGGLAPALRALARRSALPVVLDGEVTRRLDRAIEVAAYYVVSETLANASKHAEASKVAITVAEDGDALVLAVADDGVGGADPARGSGLLGIIDRVEALGGSLTLHSPPGGGTEVRGRLPLGGDPPASRREE